MSVEELRNISQKALKFALKENVDQAQVATFMFDSASTRFANCILNLFSLQNIGLHESDFFSNGNLDGYASFFGGHVLVDL